MPRSVIGYPRRLSIVLITIRAAGTAVAAVLSSTLAFSGWVARGFGETVEERAGDCRHVLGVRGR